MNPRQDPAVTWQPVFDEIDALMNGHPDEALKLCEHVFVESYLWEPLLYVRAAERYGKIMDHLGRAADARDSLFAAHQAAQASCLHRDEAKILERIARGYYSGGDYRRAMQYWTSCAEVGQQAGDDAETWILAKVGLAQVYKGAGDHAASMSMLAEAQARAAQLGNPHLDAKVKINLAVVLIESERREAAAAVLQEAFAICAANQLFDYLAESNLYLGKIALADGALERATTYLEAGLVAARQVNFRWCEGHLLTVQAEVFARSAKFKMALDAVKAAQAIASADGFPDMLIQQHFAAAEYAASLGDYAAAFAEHKAGRACEQRLHADGSLARGVDLNEATDAHQRLNRLLLELSDNEVIDHGDPDPAFQLIAQAGSHILRVARVSLWILQTTNGSLVQRCVHAEQTATAPLDPPLLRSDYPVYFERLINPHPLVAHDALHHPHTAELVHSYLGVHGIRSMLMLPIRLAGQTVGALCFEGVGTQRNWTQDDLQHGKQLADMAARVLANDEYKQSREEIRSLHSRLARANDVLEQQALDPGGLDGAARCIDQR